jgi:serine/threonine protein phosphatase 1
VEAAGLAETGARMIGYIRRLLGGGDAGPRPGPKTFEGRLEIDKPTYAIGDVHGRDDLLERLLRRIGEDAESRGYEDWRIVLMGDYVDRGEQSAEVLSRLRTLLAGGGPAPETRALRGNHEEMMLRFVDAPVEEGPRWLRNGGLQTLLSYGVRGVTLAAEPEAFEEAGARLAEAAADDLPVIRALPVWLRHGSVLFCHAGADPELPPDLQSERTLTWGTPRLFQLPRTDGLWIVYGHYIVDEAVASQGRIAVDTGAYHTGVLSAVRLDGPEPAFLSI